MDPKTIAYILILAFFAIVFIQSGIDKVVDKKGNLSFLFSHLGKVFTRQLILLAFYTVTVLELISGLFFTVGTLQVLVYENKFFGEIGLVTGSFTLLILLFGQRSAKDYDGARTIAIYFIVSIIGLLLA
tara:strand:+ start:293 stop:679 length:387 start_codon:yes stop_codon:yes gene_type:complete